jgi:hypothetical protein
MADTTLPGVLLSGTHSARPAASAVAGGTLYAETDTGQTYQSNGSSTWTAWGAVSGGGGGGGLTQTYVGTNSVGGSTDALTTARIWILKQIVLAAAAFIPSVEIYCSGNATNPTFGWYSVLATDNGSSAPGVLLSVGAGGEAQSAGIFMDSSYRWVSVPLGAWLAAGTYWIGACTDVTQFNHPNLKYDTPGGVSDVYGAPPSYLGESGGWPTNTGRSYSLRAPVLQ